MAGDSVGGNMTAALTLMAKQRGDVRFVHQSLYYTTDPAQRAEITASPLRATLEDATAQAIEVLKAAPRPADGARV
ncbi:hypothetical protein GCM10009850_029820 [Nonomuraea monospora]|uniref:Alpha/beta hydrolase fold-3 domain-containing protein n=1 Tax=Nonomuraea monospora TaxID=568818 RepID=A0ABN3CFK4_9ACTN